MIDIRNAAGQRFAPTPAIIPGAFNVIDDVDDALVDHAIGHMEARAGQHVLFFFVSGGGDHDAAIRFVRAIERHKGGSTAIIGERCCSAAMTMACACDTTKAHSDSRLLIHGSRVALARDRYVSSAGLDDLKETIEKANHQTLSVYMKKSGMSVSGLKKLMALDAPLSAGQALEFKLVDAVLPSNAPRLPEKAPPTEALRNLVASFSSEGQRHVADKLGIR